MGMKKKHRENYGNREEVVMIEKVNPSHPDKLADRVAGAIVDLAYRKTRDPKVAVEVLTGHGNTYVIIESSETFTWNEIKEITERIIGEETELRLVTVKQDTHLAKNQNDRIRCGDNGIFKGIPLTEEQKQLSKIAREIYKSFPYDGKYILDKQDLIVCQSNASQEEIEHILPGDLSSKINPIGEWTGGPNVDSGATNRKLGSDMADSVTGGGLHGKDLSKADVSANIYAFLKAQETGNTVEMHCAIGDEEINGVPYGVIVNKAREYIKQIGGFEKLAEWGLF